jgi:hypothetical protein
MRRTSDLTEEITKRENEILEHDRCLKDQIAVLEGHRSSYPAKPKPNELSESLHNGLARISQNNLDAEDWIDNHNRMHPEKPWAGAKDLTRELCGIRERAVRDRQLKEEADGRK